MGFASVAGQVILFLSILVIIGASFQTAKITTMQTSLALKQQKERYDVLLNTQFDIENISFDETSNPCLTKIDLKNSGSTKHIPSDMEIYIDGHRVPTSSVNSEIIEMINPNIWDPGENININASFNITSGSHLLEIVSVAGFKKSDIYSTATSCLVENECILNADCDDNSTYTVDICSNNYCTHVPLECIVDNDCDDGNDLTIDVCTDNICEYTELECVVDIDCDDSNESTSDACVNNICEYTALECIVDLDCNDSDEYTLDACVDNSCEYTPLECVIDIDCDDSNPLTTDTCVDNVCNNEAPVGSCTQNSDCETGETCIYGECWSEIVGYWNFDSDDNVTAYDSSPNNIDGSYVGTLSTINSGINNNALFIDQLGDYIDLPYTSKMNFEGLENMTISVWANITGSTGYGNGYTIFDAPGTYRSSYVIEKYSSGGFRYKLDLGSTDILEWDREGINGRYPNSNEWYHIVGTYDGNEMRIYINGILDNYMSKTGTIDSVGVTDVFIGSNYLGEIDEVILFNKTINSTEVTKLYNLGQ